MNSDSYIGNVLEYLLVVAVGALLINTVHHVITGGELDSLRTLVSGLLFERAFAALGKVLSDHWRQEAFNEEAEKYFTSD